MSCPEDVIDLSSLYLKIYFIGMPMNMLYNFSSALLRAVGDTKRPLYCLAAAGIINVVLNLVFVIGFSMSVAGVALATIISETVSACLVTAMLVREKGALHLDLHKLGFHAGALKQILLIGLPAEHRVQPVQCGDPVRHQFLRLHGRGRKLGIVQSGRLRLHGHERLCTGRRDLYQPEHGCTQVSQSGPRDAQLPAVRRGHRHSLGGGAALAGRQLLHFYSSDEAVIAAGYERLWIICGTYLLCGIMDTLASSLRGLGYSVLPMVVSLIGSCLLRLVWIATIFQLNRTPFMLYISYPISWVLTASVHLICLLVVRRKLQKRAEPAGCIILPPSSLCDALRGSLISRRSASSPHRPHCIPQRAAAFHRAAALFTASLPAGSGRTHRTFRGEHGW